MKFIQYLFHWLYRLARHNNEFLLLIKFVESFVSKVLSVFMIGIIFFALYDIGIFLVEEWLTHSTDPLRDRLFEAFGLFLNVLIALELLDNITAYLKNHVIQLELVIVTAIIAIARKIIIFDLKKNTTDELMLISVAILLLAFSHVLISKRKR
ncbi:MAG: phosphate-starvation-inducible PsiE family protein [Spirulina sp. SIO3F2]|nr:phosphate-starvation-inducible PsiE family protein [Spirulina sp. SIO3F2]